MMGYLSHVSVLLKHFAQHVEAMSERLKKAATEGMQATGRPVVYLPSATVSKEEEAKKIAHRDGVKKGPICLLTSVEPCWTYGIQRDRKSKRLLLQTQTRKCLFLYWYQIHPKLGFMHTRIQSWFPFNIQVCLNGREWLARQMDRQHLEYRRRENCFVWLKDQRKAQALLDAQLKISWPTLLNELGRQINPAHDEMFGDFAGSYYWSAYQSEWATDILFRNASTLANLYPRLVRHGISTFSSPDVMRFLGRKVPTTGYGRFRGEVVSDLKHRPEGLRIKHRVDRNSIKLYDKQGSVLRIETTINDPHPFKVFRRAEGIRKGPRSWRPMRRGIADLQRRAQVSQAANRRYAGALAAVDSKTPLGHLIEPLCRPAMLNGRRVRPLHLGDPDELVLLRAVSHGEFIVSGFRNRDLRTILYPSIPHENLERISARVTRLLRLLRAHQLIRRVPKSQRYLLTPKGHQAIAAILAAHAASTQDLSRCAA